MAKAPPPPEACLTCRFFLAQAVGPWAGICRRLPPVLVVEARADRVPSSVAGRSAYPLVLGDGWCGEYDRA